jgi:hypothetical protein
VTRRTGSRGDFGGRWEALKLKTESLVGLPYTRISSNVGLRQELILAWRAEDVMNCLAVSPKNDLSSEYAQTATAARVTPGVPLTRLPLLPMREIL